MEWSKQNMKLPCNKVLLMQQEIYTMLVKIYVSLVVIRGILDLRKHRMCFHHSIHDSVADCCHDISDIC